MPGNPSPATPKPNHRRENMVFSKGFIFRTGQRIKEIGERMAHKRVLGIPVLRPFCGPVIVLGLAIKDSVMNCPIAELSGEK